jgi:hypothetical protein
VAHPLEYELQQARHEDSLRIAAQQRQIAEAERSITDEPRSAHYLSAATVCFRWASLRLAKIHEPLHPRPCLK